MLRPTSPPAAPDVPRSHRDLAPPPHPPGSRPRRRGRRRRAHARRLLRDQPDHHQDEYSASDGVRFTLGDVRGSNLHVLVAAEGDPGTLQGGLINDSSEDRSVTLAIGDEETVVELGPKETVLLGVSDAEDEGYAEVTFAADRRPAGRPGRRHHLHARGRLDRRAGARARRHAARVRLAGAHRTRRGLIRTHRRGRPGSDGPFCVGGLSRSGPRCSPPWPARAARRRSSPCRRSRPAGPARPSPRG